MTVPAVIVFLTGMMASGKSRLGSAMAERFDAQFVDLDRHVEERTGETIAELFASGEAAFRRAEADALDDLVTRATAGRWVVATGGGTPVDPGNARRMDGSGARVYLQVPAEELVRRLDAEQRRTRPLLASGSVHETIANLLEQRAASYEQARYRIDGSRPTETLVTEVGRLVGWNERARRVAIAVPERDRGYDVLVEPGALSNLGAHVRARVPDAGSAMIVSDENVAPLYLGAARATLEAAGFEVHASVVAPGESSKSLEGLGALVDDALLAGLGRDDVVIALGGGVVGDLAGACAATCMRGLPFIQVPTSLLAQVDASVGGKVAINRPSGKNLFGAFHFPRLVLADPLVLTTLDQRQRAAGLAEMLKHGALFDPSHFERIVSNADDFFSNEGLSRCAEMIARSVQLKARCVAADPRERRRGGRELLNLGHTVGHALEHLSKPSLVHGEAVALGLIAAARISAALGMCGSGVEAHIVRALKRCRLPDEITPWLARIHRSALIGAVAGDKKRQGAVVRFVVLRELGQPEVVPLAPARIDRLLRG
jgi:3-dehydroquinate synthase